MSVSGCGDVAVCIGQDRDEALSVSLGTCVQMGK